MVDAILNRKRILCSNILTYNTVKYFKIYLIFLWVLMTHHKQTKLSTMIFFLLTLLPFSLTLLNKHIFNLSKYNFPLFHIHPTKLLNMKLKHKVNSVVLLWKARQSHLTCNPARYMGQFNSWGLEWQSVLTRKGPWEQLGSFIIHNCRQWILI